MPVRLEPTTPRSRVKHSTTEPLRSLIQVTTSIQRDEEDNTMLELLVQTVTSNTSHPAYILGPHQPAREIFRSPAK